MNKIDQALLPLLALLGWGACGAAAADAASSGAAGLPQVISWDSVKRYPDFWTGSWQKYEAPRPALQTNGPPPSAELYPLTRYAQHLLATQPPGGGAVAVGSNCGIQGMPGVMTSAAMPIKFMAAPGLISIWAESAGALRFIRMDGREPDPEPDPTYLGNSVGHWQGDTLVVDTRGFTGDIKLDIGMKPSASSENGPAIVSVTHGPHMRIVERIKLLDQNSLQITRMLYDDSLYTKPLSDVSVYRRFISRNAEPQEWFCSNNRDRYDPATNTTLDNVTSK